MVPATLVLLVSIDGLAWDQLQRERDHMPTVSALMKAGVSGPATTVFPSVTWPAHATVVTGRMPRTHGVIGNYFLDRRTGKRVKTWSIERSGLQARTIYDVARVAGRTSAAVLWPSTQGSPSLDWNIPEIYEPEEFQKWVTPGLADELEKAGVPARNLAKHSKLERYLLDRTARDAAVHIIQTHGPHLMMVHFTSADTYGHKAGPASPEMRWGLETIDGFIADLLSAYERAGLRQRTNVIIVSDHGFSRVRWRVDPNRLIRRASRGVRAVGNGYIAYLYGRSERQLDRAVRAMRAHPKDIVQAVYKPAQYAELGLPTPKENPKIGDRIVLAKPHAYFKKTTNGKTVQDLQRAGMHGHLPSAPGNKAVFVAAGPGANRLTAPVSIHLRDIAPTVIRLLGVQPDPVFKCTGKCREIAR